MQLDKETKLKQEKERCRQLAQRVAEEARPASAQVLNSESDLLEKALRRAGIRAEEWSAQAAEPVDLLVVEDPVWSHLPQQLPEKVLLASVDSTMMAAWAEQLARRGYYRDFRWRSKGRAQQSALFCTGSAVPAPLMMVQGYEQEMDTLRDRMVRAERTCSEEAALIERLRSDLALSRSHEQQLEKTLSDVTNSTFWKLTWPMRYAVSKSRQIWHTFPLFVFLHDLRAMGVEGVREQARARREYAVLFPSKTLRADRFAPVELLVKQASHQPGGEAGPKISIVVPLYNTPLNFLEELLDSVVNQTYRNWELCCVDAGQDTAVGQHVQARAKADPRIRYQKLTENEGIAGNTNHGFELATGDYIALLDHDDILHPCALWYTAQAIVEQGADFVYTDEATFEGKVENVVLYHFKPDFMLDNLRSNNYICHLSVFSAALLAKVGGDERAEFNGSQDYDLYLRLTEQAKKVVHIPHLLYYWRSSPTSVASNISAKMYCLEAAMKALRAHYKRVGVPVDDVTMIPNTPGFYKTDYTITKPGKVSILIPSCDHGADLRTCVDSIYRKTTYADFEVLIIENNSKEDPHSCPLSGRKLLAEESHGIAVNIALGFRISDQSLELRVFVEVFAAEVGVCSHDEQTDQTGRDGQTAEFNQADFSTVCHRMAGDQSDHRNAGDGHRRADHTHLSSDRGSCHRTFRTDTGLDCDVINNRKECVNRMACTAEDRQCKGAKRSEEGHNFRTFSQNLFSDLKHAVQAAGSLQCRTCCHHGDDGQNNVDRRFTRRKT